LSTLRVVLANLLLVINGPTHYSWQNITNMQLFRILCKCSSVHCSGMWCHGTVRLMADVLKQCSGLVFNSQKVHEK